MHSAIILDVSKKFIASRCHRHTRVRFVQLDKSNFERLVAAHLSSALMLVKVIE